MAVVRSGLSVFSLAFAMLCGASLAAQAQTFSFRVCNNSGVPASVATSSYVAVGDSRFVVQGWWGVAAHTCNEIGTFPSGWFYYYAEETGTQRIVWRGNAVQLCVRHPGPWQRINSSGYTCQSDEDLVGFTAEFIANNTGTFTANLN